MQSDPRVFFASERTLLAWVRTGIAIVGLGFVVSRFGLFLRVMAVQAVPHPLGAASQGHANLLGICLVVLGAASIAGASLQHGRFIATLPTHDRPARYSTAWALALGTLVSAASVALAAYLWVSA